MDKIIIGNLKAYLNLDQTLGLFSGLENSNRLILSPSIPYLGIIRSKYPDFQIASQDISLLSDEFGAHTGETPASMIKDMGVNYCIIGHSERKKSELDNDKTIKMKIGFCIKNNVQPIICIGESLEDRKSGRYLEIIGAQLEKAILNISGNFIIAYEPVWSIGTGKIPTIPEIEEVASYLRKSTKSLDNNVFLVYGGSVNEENAKNIAFANEIDGLLIGKASTDPKKLKAIIEITNSR